MFEWPGLVSGREWQERPAGHRVATLRSKHGRSSSTIFHIAVGIVQLLQYIAMHYELFPHCNAEEQLKAEGAPEHCSVERSGLKAHIPPLLQSEKNSYFVQGINVL